MQQFSVLLVPSSISGFHQTVHVPGMGSRDGGVLEEHWRMDQPTREWCPRGRLWTRPSATRTTQAKQLSGARMSTDDNGVKSLSTVGHHSVPLGQLEWGRCGVWVSYCRCCALVLSAMIRVCNLCRFVVIVLLSIRGTSPCQEIILILLLLTCRCYVLFL